MNSFRWLVGRFWESRKNSKNFSQGYKNWFSLVKNGKWAMFLLCTSGNFESVVKTVFACLVDQFHEKNWEKIFHKFALFRTFSDRFSYFYQFCFQKGLPKSNWRAKMNSDAEEGFKNLRNLVIFGLGAESFLILNRSFSAGLSELHFAHTKDYFEEEGFVEMVRNFFGFGFSAAIIRCLSRNS